jgi:hypothetical protein
MGLGLFTAKKENSQLVGSEFVNNIGVFILFENQTSKGGKNGIMKTVHFGYKVVLCIFSSGSLFNGIMMYISRNGKPRYSAPNS